MSNGLDPDHDRHSVCPDLGPNCLLRLSVEDKNAASMKTANYIPLLSTGQLKEAQFVL